jgi:hypothetical protein
MIRFHSAYRSIGHVPVYDPSLADKDAGLSGT